MNSTSGQAASGGRNMGPYMEAIYAALEAGLMAKEVVCSITTGFRLIPSMRAAPGLNPYHASVADAGYGFDAVQGTIERLSQGEPIAFAKELLVFDLDTLRVTQEQLHANFELAVMGAGPDAFFMVEQSRHLNHRIAEQAKEAAGLGRALLGPEWEPIRARIENVQSVPRL